MITRLLLALILITSSGGQAMGAESLTGVASVIDGDTLGINGTRIRLHRVACSKARLIPPASPSRSSGRSPAAITLLLSTGRIMAGP